MSTGGPVRRCVFVPVHTSRETTHDTAASTHDQRHDRSWVFRDSTKSSYLQLGHRAGPVTTAAAPDQLSAQDVQNYLIYPSRTSGVELAAAATAHSPWHSLPVPNHTGDAGSALLPCPGAKVSVDACHEILNHDELVRLFTVTTNLEASLRADDSLCRRVAGKRARAVAGLSDIDSATDVSAHRPGQGQQGPLRPALAPAAGAATRVLASQASRAHGCSPLDLLGPPDDPSDGVRTHLQSEPRTRPESARPAESIPFAIAYATGLLEAGVELPVIQRRLGHNSIRSTMRYLHLAQDKTSATPSPLDLLEFPSRARA